MFITHSQRLIIIQIKKITMGKYIIKTMGNIDWMAITPLIMFFTVFLMVFVVWMFRSKQEIAQLASIPFEDGSKQG
jgi:cbb3-type cytochrome oxidase subunit 3